MILDQILAHKVEEVAIRKEQVPLARLRAQAELQEPPRDFIGALRDAPRPALIAECKKASPSRGLLRAAYDVQQLAQTYDDNGAAALSVVTDERFFQGSLDDLVAARSISLLPALRKDFLVDEYQLYEARAAGADAILLIVAALDDARLKAFYQLACALRLAAMIEVHDLKELERAFRVGPQLVGVNNRNLRDFSVDFQTTAKLRVRIPGNVIVVAESGIHSAADVEELALMGVDAMLVGEALVTATDVRAKVRELVTR
ncbi:MAG: indole-3-glycerol phosphate synthase TrpC [Chloroflexi bacterium]|nr:indole-3-glycerol phosphate synthase TrpC [Chloroflexota bacterium]